LFLLNDTKEGRKIAREKKKALQHEAKRQKLANSLVGMFSMLVP
jgi:hypothetical protein